MEQRCIALIQPTGAEVKFCLSGFDAAHCSQHLGCCTSGLAPRSALHNFDELECIAVEQFVAEQVEPGK